MEKLIARALLLGALLVGGCTKQEPVAITNTPTIGSVSTIDPTLTAQDIQAPVVPPDAPIREVAWKMTPRSNLVFYVTFGQTMLKLEKLSETQRTAIFEELASGKTVTLKKLVGSNADHFLRLVRLIEGYRNNRQPPASEYQKLFGYWQRSAAYDYELLDQRVDEFAFIWDHQFVGGFGMDIGHPLDSNEMGGGGGVSYGWRIHNNGSRNWPKSMMIEPIPGTPTELIELIKPIKVDSLVPKQAGEIRLTIRVPDRLRGTRVTFISSFIDDRGVRRYIRPRPRLGIPEFGPPEGLLTLVL